MSEIPAHIRVPKLKLTSTGQALYFHFDPAPEDKENRCFGWAIATVNNSTGEVAIQSDWGNWSYRWHVNSLGSIHQGRKSTLVEFIGERDPGHCEYLADKLTSHEERHQFDADDTSKAAQRILCEKRREQGRALIEYYADEEPEDRVDVGTDDPPRYWVDWIDVRPRYAFQDEKWPLTKQIARRIFDELDRLSSCRDDREWMDGFFQIEGHEWISDEPWHADILQFSPSTAYYHLLHGILPALVRACAARGEAKSTAAIGWSPYESHP